ncbi:hypothetical protein HPB52_014372 [Rhipicephalus sanguineus]|uniref:THAP-type domain-containing protein n=1 Tax=Rhipicephalus sanguineus TaxID=34632 RepID=A0A9D4SX13_RHISA|nr:hypothetical protein HPB52_014372 [Rhipicephalus sanguineus]
MVNCAVYGCSNRTRNSLNDENFQRVGFNVVPKVISGQCAKITELSSKRRALWLSRIRREDLDESATHYRVCGAHFITGKTSLFDGRGQSRLGASFNLGYKSTTHAKRSASNSLTFETTTMLPSQRVFHPWWLHEAACDIIVSLQGFVALKLLPRHETCPVNKIIVDIRTALRWDSSNIVRELVIGKREGVVATAFLRL